MTRTRVWFGIVLGIIWWYLGKLFRRILCFLIGHCKCWNFHVDVENNKGSSCNYCSRCGKHWGYSYYPATPPPTTTKE